VGEVDRANASHALFALFLLFKQLFLSGYVAAVALGKNVLAERLYGLAGDDFAADGRLNRDFEELTGIFSFSRSAIFLARA